MNSGIERRLFWITVAAFVGIALWPIWSTRFPPMQDYPGQLFYSEVLDSHGIPGSDFDRYYEFRLHPVYATFYLTTLVFAKLVPMEIAGKLSLSLYPLLIALVVLRLEQRLGAAFVPWGALLFFPFAFNQQYYYGNLDYFLSLPMLVLALLDFEEFIASPLYPWSIVRNAAWQIALIVTHPLSFVVFVAMAIGSAILIRRPSGRPWRAMAVTATTALLLFAALWLGGMTRHASGGAVRPGLTWYPLSVTLEFFALMFDGMQPLRDARLESLLLWIAVLAVVCASYVIARRTRSNAALPGVHIVFLGLSIVAMMALPFRIGDFSYVNVRLSALVYFVLALCVAHVRFNRWLASAIVGLLALCLIESAAKQLRISAEVAEVLPVIESIPPNSRVLPLVFEPASAELDRFWFSPHVQDYNYYHVIVGGGFNPYLLGSPIDPVRPKPGEARPAPTFGQPPFEFTWGLYSSDYEYFLVLGGPKELAPYLESHCSVVATSGRWMLFKRNTS